MLATKKWAAGKAPVRVMFLCVALLAGCTPPGPRAVLEGEKLLLQGNYPQAVAMLQRATGLLPQNAQAWNHLGLAYHGAGQAAEAEKAYQQALAPGRNLTVAHYNLGCLYFEEGQYAAAADELRAFTVLQPQHMPAWLRLANAQLRLRQYDAADRSFRYILSINPKSPEAWNGMGIAQLHQRNRARDAMQCFNAALQYQGNYQPALFNIALATHHYLNNRPAALQKYREYLALSPRPENAPLVQALADQLELELNPPKPAVTNLATNLPPQPVAPPAAANAVTNRTVANIATNLPAPVRTAATNSRPETIAPPKTNVAVAPKPVIPPSAGPEVKAPPAAPAKEMPVEITKVTEPPAIRPAQDAPVAPKAPTPAPTVAATNPVAKPTAPAAPAPAVKTAAAPAVATVPPPAESAENSTNKPGFFQRINPVNLFKRTPKTEVPPLPATNETSTLIVSNAAATTPARRTGVPPLPAPAPSARYTYRRPEKPAGGQRTAAEPYFNEGLLAHKRGQMTAAMAGYEKALQLDPAYFEAQHNLALAIQDTGSLAQALAAYETALAIQPASSAARFNFASALRAGEYYTDAANELEKVLADYPSDADAHLALANLYAQRLARPQAARPHYQKVLQLAPRHPKATDIRYWLAANPQ